MIPESLPASQAPAASPDALPSSPRLSLFWPQGFSQAVSSDWITLPATSTGRAPPSFLNLSLNDSSSEQTSQTTEWKQGPTILSPSAPHGPLFPGLRAVCHFLCLFCILLPFVCLFMRNVRSMRVGTLSVVFLQPSSCPGTWSPLNKSSLH